MRAARTPLLPLALACALAWRPLGARARCGEASAPLTNATSISLTEGGGAVAYQVWLGGEPLEETAVLNAASAEGLNVSPSELFFNASNWDEPQLVFVEAQNDGVASGGWTAAVAHATDTSHGNCSAAVLVEVADVDVNRQGMEGAAGRQGYAILTGGTAVVGKPQIVRWLAPAAHDPGDRVQLWRARPAHRGALGGADLIAQHEVGQHGEAKGTLEFRIRDPGIYKLFWFVKRDGSYAAYSEEFTALGDVRLARSQGKYRPTYPFERGDNHKFASGASNADGVPEPGSRSPY